MQNNSINKLFRLTNSLHDYKAMISTLPSRSLMVADNSLQASLYRGFWHVPAYLEMVMTAQDHFIAQPPDIFVCSPLKTGTTWLTALTFAIATRKKFDISKSPLQNKLPQDCVPFLGTKKNLLREHPLLATHIPYTSLPNSIVNSDCKIVYMWRNPNDTFVSLCYFIRKALPEGTEFLPIEEAFDEFCNGFSIVGPYWEHVLGYWRASLERPGKILFLKYEDMKENTFCNVKKLAEFMGFPFSLDEEKEGVVEKIIELCSFEHLSNLEENKSGKTQPNGPYLIENDSYFRKGVVGDWKNHITPKMKEKLDQIMEEKLKGSGLNYIA